jgi:hypothetical protein
VSDSAVERDELLHAIRRRDDEIRYLRERHAAEVAGLRAEIDRLMDPIVRAKMMEPAPPIVLPAGWITRERAVALIDGEWGPIKPLAPKS